MALLIICLLPACTSVLRNPPPESVYQSATVLGRSDLRIFGDLALPTEWAADSNEAVAARFSGVTNREHHYLAISGGGANGAYGAGLLVGWTQRGTRPEFAMVTGISTGALIAPFAFLGPEYDDQLREVYTTLDTTNILRKRSLFSALSSDSLASVEPMMRVLEEYVTEDMVAKIASEYRKGRTLQVATTNLDARSPVFWNIGRIADSGHPDAVGLIRDILRASASIPGVFPPVYIDVEGPDGQVYDEMHVDGGTSAQMFLYPSQLDFDEFIELLGVKGTPTAYLIRNSTLEPDYAPVDPKLLSIVGTTVGSLIRTQSIGDTYRIYTLGRRDGIEVKLTWIPNGAVPVEPQEIFDPDYMSALFEFGFERALSGEPFVDVADAIRN